MCAGLLIYVIWSSFDELWLKYTTAIFLPILSGGICMTSPDSHSHDEWNAYWRDGRVAACRSDDEGLYQGAIGQYWQQVFASLNPGARILDLATGNGALAEVAVKQAQTATENTSSEPYFSFIGVDQADIAPPILDQVDQKICALKFYPQTSNESLPFADHLFDQVTAQYGVEYGDLAQTLRETCRVLKADGQLNWVCHWRPGTVVQKAIAEIEDIGYFQSLKLESCMQGLVRLQVKSGHFIANSHQLTANSPERLALQAGLNRAFERLRMRGHNKQSNLNIFLQNLAHLYQYREQQAPALVLSKLAECGQQLEFHRLRLQAMADAALTPGRRDILIENMKSLGLQVFKHGELIESRESKVLGYHLNAGFGTKE